MNRKDKSRNNTNMNQNSQRNEPRFELRRAGDEQIWLPVYLLPFKIQKQNAKELDKNVYLFLDPG
jgi:hypothetical protein